MSAEEEQEETIIEYARFHGLTSDYVAEPTPLSDIAALRELCEDSLSDATGLTQIHCQPPLVADERITVDKDTARLLAGANTGFLNSKALGDTITALSDIRRRQKLKLELPILRTEPDADFASFKVHRLEGLDHASVPSEPLDDERDEGVQWPSTLTTLPGHILKECKSEKIQVHKGTLLYIQAALNNDWMGEDQQAMLYSQTMYKRDTVLDTITPPLSPLIAAEPEPFIPSSPDCYLPLLSDPASLLSADLEAAEKVIFEYDAFPAIKDEIYQEDGESDDQNRGRFCNPQDIFPELESLPSDELFPNPERMKKEDLKVEAGLTPPLPTPTYPKTVTFSDVVEEMLLDHEYSDSASSRADSRNENAFFLHDGLYEVLEQASETVNRKVEQEQLQEAATTKKVHVPNLDFALPEPPWKELEKLRFSSNLSQAQNTLISTMKAEHGITNSIPGIRKLEECLRWTPFPVNLARIALEEELGSDNDFLPFITSLNGLNVVTSADVTYKKPGLRIVEEAEDDGDEDLEPGTFLAEQPEDLASLLRKRKLQVGIDEVLSNNQLSDSSTTPTRGKRPSRIANEFVAAGQVIAGQNEEIPDNLIGGQFSAALSLDNFMEMRGKKKQKLTDSNYFASSQVAPVPPPQSLPVAQNIPIPHVMKTDLALPLLQPPSTSTPFIISTSLLNLRPLVKTVQALFPTAQFIERDFTRHNTTSWLKPGTIVRSPIISSLASEADLIISPSTGAVLTSLTRIKQKPLPGQKAKTEIREKIEAVSMRYERLLVFISEGSLDESSRGLNGQDCMAFTEFLAFCASLPTSANVIFVPGGHQTLAKWLVSAMIEHGMHDPVKAGLLEEETIWELFLRRCGMNSYAAQSVSAELKAPEGVNLKSPSKHGIYGICAFVEMDHEERIRRFGALLGGERVLGMVSRVIDIPWRDRTP